MSRPHLTNDEIILYGSIGVAAVILIVALCLGVAYLAGVGLAA